MKWRVHLGAFILGLTLLGCKGDARRMEHPENTAGRYKSQIAAARRLLEQKEDWADRVEWEVQKHGNEWHVFAWRIEHPKEKGPMRYLPWGYSLIILDNREVAISYHNRG